VKIKRWKIQKKIPRQLKGEEREVVEGEEGEVEGEEAERSMVWVKAYESFVKFCNFLIIIVGNHLNTRKCH
jgi:hypothetical protein